MAFIDSGKGFNKDENYEKMKTRMENMDTAQYTLRIPTALYKEIRIKVAKEDKKLRWVLIEMLEEYLKK